LTNGIVTGDTIRFHYLSVNPYVPTLPAQVDYLVTNAAGRLSISGSITSSWVCCDIPYRFVHQHVTAAYVPGLSLRVGGEVELGWSSALNQYYQVEWVSDPAEGAWANLGPPILGSGTTNSVVDTEASVLPRRFYRVVPLP
jgi:hypothetical protein